MSRQSTILPAVGCLKRRVRITRAKACRLAGLPRKPATPRENRNERRSVEAVADGTAAAQGSQGADHRLRQRRKLRAERRISARYKPERRGAGPLTGRA